MKKQFKITKDQVLEVYTWGNSRDKVKMKEWFPEAFEGSELKSGVWYKTSNVPDFLVMITDLKKGMGYGFNGRKQWQENGCWWGSGNLVEASDEEVKLALIRESSIRYKSGDLVSDLCRETRVIDIEGANYDYYLDADDFYFDGLCMYRKGEWAKVIDTKKGLEVGTWYKDTDGCIVNYQGGNKGYGVTSYGAAWYYNDGWGFEDGTENWSKTSDDEVEVVLVNEANKRGYKEGVSIDFVAGKCTLNNVDPYLRNGDLWYGDCRVFVNGKWAEIINNTITREEAERILNKTIV